jgi:hypothetical protein
MIRDFKMVLAISRKKSIWAKLLKLVVLIVVSVWLYSTPWFWHWIIGLLVLTVLVVWLYKWKTKNWTKNWFMWKKEYAKKR